ncbi:ABC transporter ATP-binding protein [Martelella mediterranea]|uniref:sn-glycerol-3-phosphate import ATP-binding protein UgpC n=1 Tax=Martelella mediterranea DSM 17316 TaxID=1122214 RepID=A0A1U9Z9R5_9HYPH|nr:sn-glycerol-3-phosphate ABC transporter ATP-binding protein UgpC [Martelella mediterranea]AQZ54441.1 sn-glycerol-3-phosphate import ATP-binding protein UgpC [Martelella mediterranea DSM 17316]
MGAMSVCNVRKNYGAVEVLHGVSLDIHDGEFVILVGPSGCGKSTLLRMIAGLEAITSGEISIAGKVVNSLPPKDRDIAMVFQSYALYPHMTVKENMGFSLKLARVEKTELDARVAAAAAMLSLDPYLDRYPRQLSGGQRQRVAMGRAIVRNPQVYLFDEPLSNLDAKLRVQMRSEIKQNHQRLKTTTVYVTHDQIEAMTMADRIVVMHDGIIEQMGTPLELYDRPSNRFVASFIGSPSMNMFEGGLKGGEFVAADGSRIALGAAAAGLADGEIVLGVRPEHFSFAPAGISVEVLTVEPTGSETQVMAEFAGAPVTAAFRERVEARPGERLNILPDAGKLHLFDARTGRRVEPVTALQEA